MCVPLKPLKPVAPETPLGPGAPGCPGMLDEGISTEPVGAKTCQKDYMTFMRYSGLQES